MIAHQSADTVVSDIAAAIGAPARARMLYCLVDGRARTSTELALVAGITPSTASVHLQRLKTQRLVRVLVQGKHRYYSLDGANVAAALESLNVLAGGTRDRFVPNTPHRLRAARSCYDHIAGALGVSLFDRFVAMRWLAVDPAAHDDAYDVTPAGAKTLATLGIDVDALRATRRRFAYGCVDWSERRPHLGGALGAAVLELALRKRWLRREPDDRALSVTALGERELRARLGLRVP
ncbi:MAG: ArsR/SmtB family transcription factor [Gemmatimonadaceae bacterium]